MADSLNELSELSQNYNASGKGKDWHDSLPKTEETNEEALISTEEEGEEKVGEEEAGSIEPSSQKNQITTAFAGQFTDFDIKILYNEIHEYQKSIVKVLNNL